MKWLAASFVTVILLLQGRLWLSNDGVSEVFRLRKAVAEQRAEDERLRERNSELGAEVRDLKNGYAALEERARNDLGMIDKSETFYQVAPGAPAAATPRSTLPLAPASPPPLRTAAR